MVTLFDIYKQKMENDLKALDGKLLYHGKRIGPPLLGSRWCQACGEWCPEMSARCYICGKPWPEYVNANAEKDVY
jgi:hypothetical protein